MQQHGLPGAAVAALFVAEVNFAVAVAAAHHQHAAGHVPDVGAVGQTLPVGHALLFVGVHHQQHRALLGGGNGLEGQQDAAHLVAAGHFHPGG